MVTMMVDDGDGYELIVVVAVAPRETHRCAQPVTASLLALGSLSAKCNQAN